jgi:hypothetical protein
MRTQKDTKIDVNDEFIDICDEDQLRPGITHKNPRG